MDNREEKIRMRAYRIWEREGQPQGLQDDHWRQAEMEMAQEEDGADMQSSPAQPDNGGLISAEAPEGQSMPGIRITPPD